MPLPLGLLAAGGISAGIGAAQAITGGRKSEFDKRNEERLDEIARLQAQGRLGLSSQEKAVREQQLVDPVRQQAEQAQSRNEAVQAASGSLTGGDLSRLRTETQRSIGEGAQGAALAISQEDTAKKQSQLAERAQLEATQEQRRLDRRASVFGGLSQAAGAAGQIAGAVPEVLRAAGLAGAPISDTLAFKTKLNDMGVPPDLQAEVLRIPPNRLTRVLNNALQGNIQGPEEVAMLKILEASGQVAAPAPVNPGGIAGSAGLDASLIQQLAGATSGGQ